MTRPHAGGDPDYCPACHDDPPAFPQCPGPQEADMNDTAVEMRAAAGRLRALADMASPGPWECGNYGDYGWTVRLGDTDDVETADSEIGKANASWIAIMQPALGIALAAWLEFEVDLVDRVPGSEMQGRTRQALAVARAINQQ